VEINNLREDLGKQPKTGAEAQSGPSSEADVEPASGQQSREFYNHLKDLYLKWIPLQRRRKDDIGEILILEEFYSSLSPELRVWVKERNPASAQEAAELVENFLVARRGPKPSDDLQQKSSLMQGKCVGFSLDGAPSQMAGVEKQREKTFSSKP
ncbi:hypothetical protein CCH79_00021044, partial [Gambusia affinis]